SHQSPVTSHQSFVTNCHRMPLYEYLCRDCDSQVELLVRSANEKPNCPDCGSGRLMKLLSVPAAPSATHSAGSDGGEPPTGPCGSACGCFPPG
ncbi:MAG: zinc ribbon domain-containing protein, partial [Planctomycetota bacterium]